MSKLIVEQLVREFPTRTDPLRILDGVSLELASGENMAILGPSGSGKSTLLHIIGTLDRPTSGSVRLGNEDPFRLAEAELAHFRNQRIGLIFQDHHLLPQCSVLENVLIPTIAHGATTSAQIERARGLLDRVGLSQRLDHRPAELSGGERQRVAIARALVQSPELLLADEPTGNLDRSTAAEVAKLLAELQQAEQTMMIVVTHSSELAAHMQRRFELDRGKLRLVGD